MVGRRTNDGLALFRYFLERLADSRRRHPLGKRTILKRLAGSTPALSAMSEEIEKLPSNHDWKVLNKDAICAKCHKEIVFCCTFIGRIWVDRNFFLTEKYLNEDTLDKAIGNLKVCE